MFINTNYIVQTLYKQGFLGKVQKSDSRDESLLISDDVFKLLWVCSMLGAGERCLHMHACLVLHSSTVDYEIKPEQGTETFALTLSSKRFLE